MHNIYTKSSDFPKYQGKRLKVVLNAGGGLFGYVITYLMSHLDFDLYSKIDVAAGTSIGGIITLLYAVNSDYKFINQLFKRHGADCFTKRSIFGSLNPPTYDSNYLKQFIQKVLGDYRLRDIKQKLNSDLKVIIPTLDLTLTAPRIFSNIIESTYQDDILNMKLTDVGLMTAAAPTYFKALPFEWNKTLIDLVKDTKKYQYDQRYLLAEQAIKRLKNCPKCKFQSAIVDGGVIENIPVLSTYTTLRSRLGVKLEDIDMLVIGTGDDMNPDEKYLADDVNKWNLIDWLTKFIIKYVTQSNELISANFGPQMGFHSFRFFNPLDVKGDMDDPKILTPLEQQCDKHIEEFKKVVNAFLNE